MVKLVILWPLPSNVPVKAVPSKTVANRIGIRGNDCRRKDLPLHINIRRQDKAFAVIRRIAGQSQQIFRFCGDLGMGHPVVPSPPEYRIGSVSLKKG